MFVAQENTNSNSSKKKFQKPNILRRKTNSINKVSIVRQPSKCAIYESPDVKSLLNASFVLDQKNDETLVDKVTKCKSSKSPVKKSVQKLKTDKTREETGNAQNDTTSTDTESMLFFGNSPIAHNEDNENRTSISVDSLLIGEVVRQNIPIYENSLLQSKEVEDQKQKWCLDFSQDSQKIIIEHYDGSQLGSIYLDQKPDVVSTMVPLAAVSSIRPEHNIVQNENYDSMATMTSLPAVSIHDSSKVISCDFSTVTSDHNLSIVTATNLESNNENLSTMDNIQKISMEQLTSAPVRFKCDMPNCNKEFMSEPKLRKHKNTHNKDNSVKAPRQTTVECPVKKVHENGLEEACRRIFHIREDLVKHLNEEHTIEEAAYRCQECGRRFFWASGLRAHARAHAGRAGRAALACPWPGCARVFRQPCRLREHARAHTGDKPYPCRYPNCGWSFRTASKLVRHARRHTGERRHACATCGRAFLRREHLRDHAARHHAPHARRAHVCPHADCQQSFTNMSSLYMHTKKVHKKEENDQTANSTTCDNQELPKVTSENLFMVSLLEPRGVESAGGAASVSSVSSAAGAGGTGASEEAHAARTHCTWPLARADHYAPDAYVLGDDVQVEQSEGSENNIYTVRSDLFLHGNVLHNEDSEPMSRCVRVSEEGALALDADLLLDAPSVHLDQEELYTDAVDESSFRVFLLSGEELA